MNLFLLQFLPIIAFLASTARSSALPVQRAGPPNPGGRPCYSKFRDVATWTLGTCIEPNDSYQCDDGITANTNDCGTSDNGRRINCCLHQSCNSRSSGTCQNNFKNCNGEWTVSNTVTGIFGNTEVPIHNPCPEPKFVTCCTQKDKMGTWKPGESSIIPNSALFSLGLCSKEFTPELCVKDKTQIGSIFQVPGDLDIQSSASSSSSYYYSSLAGGERSYLDNSGSSGGGGGDQGGLLASFGLLGQHEQKQTQIEDNNNPVISSPPAGGLFTSWQQQQQQEEEEEHIIQPPVVVAAALGGLGGVESGTDGYAQIPKIDEIPTTGGGGAGNPVIIPASYNEWTNPSWR